MPVRFIYLKGNICIEQQLNPGELFETMIPKLKLDFRIPQTHDLLISLERQTGSIIKKVMLNAPLFEQLKEVYCYDIPIQKVKDCFRKVSVCDNSIDFPELEFLIYKDSTLIDLQQIYKLTKKTNIKNFQFVRESNNQLIPMNTPIYMLQNSQSLKIVPKLVKVLINENDVLIQKVKIQSLKFKNKTARQVLLSILPEFKEKLVESRVTFNYYGVSIPEKEILKVENKDEITINIKKIDTPVEVRVKEDNGKLLQTKIFDKSQIFYKTSKEIAQLVLNWQKFDIHSTEIDHQNEMRQCEYFKHGNEIDITIRKNIYQKIQTKLENARVSDDEKVKFETFKNQLRNIFRTPNNVQQDKLLKDALVLYLHSNLI